jgi:hypothetical protein
MIPYDLADPIQHTKAVVHIKRGGKMMIDGKPTDPPTDPPHFGIIVLHDAPHAS